MHIIKASSLSVQIEQQKIISDIEIELDKEETLIINGKNGSGKSTLLKTLAGLIPYSGILNIEGRVSYLGHNTQLYLDLSTEDNLDIFLNLEEKNKALELLQRFNFESKKSASKLSKGTQKKLGLAIALARNSDILILDEPLSNLDLESQDSLISYLIDEKKSKVIASHELILNQLGHKIISL